MDNRNFKEQRFWLRVRDFVSDFIQTHGGGQSDNVIDLDIMKLVYLANYHNEDNQVSFTDFASVMGLTSSQVQDLLTGKYNKIRFTNCPTESVQVYIHKYNSYEEFQEAWFPSSSEVEYIPDNELPTYSLGDPRSIIYLGNSDSYEVATVIYANLLSAPLASMSFTSALPTIFMLPDWENNLIQFHTEAGSDEYPFKRREQQS